MLPLLVLASLGGAPTPELSVVTGGDLGEPLVLTLTGTNATVPPSENLFFNVQALDPPVFFPGLGELAVLPLDFLGPPNAGPHDWAFVIPANPVFLGASLHLQAFGFVLDGASGGLMFSTPVEVPLTTAGPKNLSYEFPSLFLKLGSPMLPDVPSYEALVVDEWSVDPPLPPGLGIDPVTGVISGVPTMLSGPTTHVVTVGNGFGEAQATVTIIVDLVGTPTLEQTSPGLVGQSLHYVLSGTTATEDVIEFLATDTVVYEPGVTLPGIGVVYVITSSPTLQIFPGNGDHEWTIALPDHPDLVGTYVYAQGSGLVLNGLNGGVRLSNLARTLLLEAP